jgi:hypothetical protein
MGSKVYILLRDGQWMVATSPHEAPLLRTSWRHEALAAAADLARDGRAEIVYVEAGAWPPPAPAGSREHASEEETRSAEIDDELQRLARKLRAGV